MTLAQSDVAKSRKCCFPHGSLVSLVGLVGKSRWSVSEMLIQASCIPNEDFGRMIKR
jgi:hypothetical protein